MKFLSVLIFIISFPSFAKKEIYAICILRNDLDRQITKPVFSCISVSQWLFTTPMFSDTRAYISKTAKPTIKETEICVRERIINSHILAVTCVPSADPQNPLKFVAKICDYSSLQKTKIGEEFIFKCVTIPFKNKEQKD